MHFCLDKCMYTIVQRVHNSFPLARQCPTLLYLSCPLPYPQLFFLPLCLQAIYVYEKRITPAVDESSINRGVSPGSPAEILPPPPPPNNHVFLSTTTPALCISLIIPPPPPSRPCCRLPLSCAFRDGQRRADWDSNPNFPSAGCVPLYHCHYLAPLGTRHIPRGHGQPPLCTRHIQCDHARYC